MNAPADDPTDTARCTVEADEFMTSDTTDVLGDYLKKVKAKKAEAEARARARAAAGMPPPPPPAPPKPKPIGPAVPKVKFRVGDAVQIHGLEGRAELNGRRGAIASRNNETRRFGVEIDAVGDKPATKVAIRPCNLTKIDAVREETRSRDFAVAGALTGMWRKAAAVRQARRQHPRTPE